MRDQSIRKISQPKIIPHILQSLSRHGGQAPKRVVEGEVYKELKGFFDQSWYQEPTASGIPRWQENVDYARNLARESGWIKPPNKSGRGVWALTEAGKMKVKNNSN
jgi:hypothetical protein